MPRGSSLVNSTRFLAQALGVALLATVLGSALSPEARQFQQQTKNGDTSGSQLVGLCESPDDKTASIPPDTEAQRRLSCEENLRGLNRAYTLTFYAALVALGIGAFLPGWPLEWLGRGATTVAVSSNA